MSVTGYVLGATSQRSDLSVVRFGREFRAAFLYVVAQPSTQTSVHPVQSWLVPHLTPDVSTASNIGLGGRGAVSNCSTDIGTSSFLSLIRRLTGLLVCSAIAAMSSGWSRPAILVARL